jgi:hypothetical protein
MAKTEATVEELVSMIERGKLRLPEMQRRYVWRSPRVRDLIIALSRVGVSTGFNSITFTPKRSSRVLTPNGKLTTSPTSHLSAARPTDPSATKIHIFTFRPFWRGAAKPHSQRSASRPVITFWSRLTTKPFLQHA